MAYFAKPDYVTILFSSWVVFILRGGGILNLGGVFERGNFNQGENFLSNLVEFSAREFAGYQCNCLMA